MEDEQLTWKNRSPSPQSHARRRIISTALIYGLSLIRSLSPRPRAKKRTVASRGRRSQRCESHASWLASRLAQPVALYPVCPLAFQGLPGGTVRSRAMSPIASLRLLSLETAAPRFTSSSSSDRRCSRPRSGGDDARTYETQNTKRTHALVIIGAALPACMPHFAARLRDIRGTSPGSSTIALSRGAHARDSPRLL